MREEIKQAELRALAKSGNIQEKVNTDQNDLNNEIN